MCNFRRKVSVDEVVTRGSAVVFFVVGGVNDCCGRDVTLGSCIDGGDGSFGWSATLGSCVGGACGFVWSENML